MVLPWIRIQIGPKSWIQIQCIWIHNTAFEQSLMFFKTKENSSEGVPVFLTNLFKLDPDPHFKAAGSGSTALCSRGSSFTFTAGNPTVLVPLLDDLQSPVSTTSISWHFMYVVPVSPSITKPEPVEPKLLCHALPASQPLNA